MDLKSVIEIGEKTMDAIYALFQTVVEAHRDEPAILKTTAP